jgi:hypothetical protein
MYYLFKNNKNTIQKIQDKSNLSSESNVDKKKYSIYLYGLDENYIFEFK